MGNSVLLEHLVNNAEEHSHVTALIEVEYGARERRRELTWLEFMRYVASVSDWLVEWGIRSGDRVALVSENCLEWLPIYFGIWRARAVAVPLNYRASPEEVAECAVRANASLLVSTVGTSGVSSERLRGRVPVMGVDEVLKLASSPRAPNDRFENSLTGFPGDAAIYFSSGTTGRPKAIVHTHASLLAGARCEAVHHSLTAQDRFLCIPPLYHAGAKIHWFGSLITGGSCVLLKGHDAFSISRAIRDERVTIMWTLGPWARDLVERVRAGDLSVSEGEYRSLRLTHMGAQPIPRELIESWKAIWSWCDYDTDYGLTEAGGPGCMHLGVENGHKAGSIGVPGMGWQARVVDDAGEDVPRGEVGELVVRGPGVMRGYLDDPVASRRVLSDGWLRTGDLVSIDSDGFAWLVDRKNDLIIVGGENVYPSEVEELVRDLKGVRDAAACGVSDTRLGEIVALLVEPTGAGPSLDSIEELCKAQLPWYKRPRVIQLGPVPRNSTGKVDRKRVNAILNACWLRNR